MASALNLPFFRSTSSLQQPSPSTAPTPGPLRIFKRPAPQSSFPTKTPLAALASPPPEANSSSDSGLVSKPLDSTSSGSVPYYSCTSSHNTSHSKHDLTANPTTSKTNKTLPEDCSLCANPLPSILSTYTFPRTAPAITARVLRLFPAMTPSPAFCATCFEAIHAVRICWGCGNPIHRPEERVGCGWGWWHWGCLRCLICRAPLPPPPWTNAPITLSQPPSCKSCTRELQHLAYTERAKASHSRYHIRRAQHKSSQRLLHPSSESHTGGDGPTTLRKGVNNSYDGPAASATRKTSIADLKRKISQGMGLKYPPLPKWMEKRAKLGRRFAPQPRAKYTSSHLEMQHDGSISAPDLNHEPQSRRLPSWMAKLPGNRKAVLKPSMRKISRGGEIFTVGKDAGRENEEIVEVSPYGYERMNERVGSPAAGWDGHSDSGYGSGEGGGIGSESDSDSGYESGSGSGSRNSVLSERRVI